MKLPTEWLLNLCVSTKSIENSSLHSPDQRVPNEMQVRFVDCLLVSICVRATRPSIRMQNWETKNNCRTAISNSSNNKLNKKLIYFLSIFVCPFDALAFSLPFRSPIIIHDFLKLSPGKMIESFHLFTKSSRSKPTWASKIFVCTGAPWKKYEKRKIRRRRGRQIEMRKDSQHCSWRR